MQHTELQLVVTERRIQFSCAHKLTTHWCTQARQGRSWFWMLVKPLPSRGDQSDLEYCSSLKGTSTPLCCPNTTRSFIGMDVVTKVVKTEEKGEGLQVPTDQGKDSDVQSKTDAGADT
ncbi:hypothetical protein EMCRGX_G008755 [Ephydatia muelleri]